MFVFLRFLGLKVELLLFFCVNFAYPLMLQSLVRLYLTNRLFFVQKTLIMRYKFLPRFSLNIFDH